MLSIHVVSVSCGAEHTIALCQEGVSTATLRTWRLSEDAALHALSLLHITKLYIIMKVVVSFLKSLGWLLLSMQWFATSGLAMIN